MDKKSAMMKPEKRSKTKAKDDGTKEAKTYGPTKKVKKAKKKTRRKQ